ncbi:ribbon-helix-helix protein, CopG family [Streptomyces sp. NPDC058001]|uniref:ribbon-helix-helix protein, CopG family n=1 Tax=Streptomyces sp. NPDC058001 TaxID=3346300 RepID=UPI0036EA0362
MTRPVGRPEIGPKLEVRVSDETLAGIEADAQRRQISRAQWLRAAVEQALPYDVLADLGRSQLADSLATLDANTGLREWALDADASRSERLIAAERYAGVWNELRTMAGSLRDTLPVQQARDAYAAAEAADPDMVQQDTAQAWARAHAADALDSILAAVVLMCPVDGGSVRTRADLDDPTADLD